MARNKNTTTYFTSSIYDIRKLSKCDDKTEGEQYDQKGRELYVTLKQSVSLKKDEKV